MRILVGCQMTYEFEQATPMIATLNVHASRVSDLERPDYLVTTPAVPIEGYRDSFGNWCNRLVAPAGRFTLKTETVIRDSGQWDPSHPDAEQNQVQDLPADTLLFLLGSRYCETDRLSDIAWSQLEKLRSVGRERRLFATSSITISRSVTNTHGRPAPRSRRLRRSAGSVATTLIWRSRFAGASIFRPVIVLAISATSAFRRPMRLRILPPGSKCS